MPSFLHRWLPLALLTVAALWLRMHDLDRRPMHADEANQAVKAGELLESGRYAFDPADHHGPTLYYAVLPVAWLRGEHTLAQLSERTVRLVPALAGTLAVVLLFLLAEPLGRWPALAAAAFLAAAPPAVYYSRYFIQETLLLTFTLGLLLCARRWWRHGTVGPALGAGLCLGLMQATKASAPVFALTALGAWLLLRTGKPAAARPGRDLAVAVAGSLGLVVLLYTSFLAHPGGLRDALLTYGRTLHRFSAGTGHEKPWWYYLQLLTTQRNGGLVWQQLAFTLLALAGGMVAVAKRDQPLLRWATLYTAAVVLVLSCTPYKTPWHAVHFVPGLALLAGGALAAAGSRPGLRLLAPALGLAVLLTLLLQTRLTSFTLPADARNPYAYVHSSPDVKKYRALVEAALARFPDRPVRIISEENWPLPWYLRGLPRTGYWTTVPADCDGALVIASAGLGDEVRARLHGPYRVDFLGLRPGFACVVFTPTP